jgi:hypothetical protein
MARDTIGFSTAKNYTWKPLGGSTCGVAPAQQ